MTDHRFGQQYACSDRYCGGTRMLPEHPRTGPLTVRAACPECERIRTLEAVGRVGGTIRGATYP